MKTILLLLAITTLSSCSADKPEDAKGVIPKHQLEALEKAKAVENTLLEASKKRMESPDGT